MPETITSIDTYAFYGCSTLTEVTIPDSVTSIGTNAFRDCTNLSNVTLSKKLQTLGEDAFRSCASLLKIEIPKSLESVPSVVGTGGGPFYSSGLTTVTFEAGTTKVVGNLFQGASNLANVTLLDTMTTIEKYAFYNCLSLSDIVLPETITSIDTYAFYGCSALTEVTIPDNVVRIGTRAFQGCASLAKVTLPSGLPLIDDYTFNGCSSLTSVQLPEVLQEIGDYAFTSSGLISIEIPGNCTSMGSHAFQNCISLVQAVLHPGVKTIGAYCFDGCVALETISLSDGLTGIGNYAFQNCDALTKIGVPDSVTSIGTYIFAYCDTLAQVDLGSGLTTIPQYAFYECPSLQSITLPYRVTTISAYAFANCTGLTEITIPQSVTSIVSTAFSYPGKMTIYGVSGSYAETFSSENGIAFMSRISEATSVVLDPTEVTISKGSTVQLTASILPEDFTDTVSWKSGNTSVATVSDTGLVKGVAVGSTVIKVVVGNVNASCTVTVVQPVTSISLNRTSLTLEASYSYQLTATANPSSAQNRQVIWSSSAPDIASVDENGLVTAYQKGTATITATAADGSGVSKSCTVTVPNNAYIVSSASGLESSHPYSNNCSDIWVYSVSDATYLELTFDTRTEVEDGFDSLYIYDGAANEIGNYTGSTLAGQAIRVEGNTVKIKIVSDESGTAWGFKVAEIRTDGNVPVYEDLLSQIDQLSELEDAAQMVSGAQALDKTQLLEAMQDQKNGAEIITALSQLEQATQINTQIMVSAEMEANFKKEDIQVLGAALNIAQLRAEGANTVTLVIGPPDKEHPLTNQYGNALAFSMHLENTSEELSVPVQITLPVPAGATTTALVLFHYKNDGTSESVDYTMSQVDNQAYVTFVLTEFSDFQFANLSCVLGDVTGDGTINIMDVHLVFNYVNQKNTLTETQLASADVNGDGDINIMDVLRLFQYVNQQIAEL